MNLISYNQAKEYVDSNKNKLRAVVSTHVDCTKYQEVCDVLLKNNISFAVMNSEDPNNYFKSKISPTTFFFNSNNTCYPFYDVFDSIMLDHYLKVINND